MAFKPVSCGLGTEPKMSLWTCISSKKLAITQHELASSLSDVCCGRSRWNCAGCCSTAGIRAKETKNLYFHSALQDLRMSRNATAFVGVIHGTCYIATFNSNQLI